jgi:hypothetical protein
MTEERRPLDGTFNDRDRILMGISSAVWWMDVWLFLMTVLLALLLWRLW